MKNVLEWTDYSGRIDCYRHAVSSKGENFFTRSQPHLVQAITTLLKATNTPLLGLLKNNFKKSCL